MDQSIINKIRENIDIVEFIGKYIPLQKRGKNYFGLCPFHSDNNPSLCVSREKQIFKCFVCGEAGNVFNFVMKYENISFMEAVKIVGNELGISVSTKENNKLSKNKELYDIYELASSFYRNNLLSKEGSDARTYLKNRKLDDNIIKEFGIGLSLNKRDTLIKLLEKKGYKLDILNNLGLASGDVDTYINRIIFPLNDINGKINGFSGRIYHGENTNKYLNTKETPIFKKGENIYNYYRAKEEVRKDKFVIVMEGFMAVIRAYTIGVKNCIALMGTALTKEQILLIKKLSTNIYLCFDGDKAGINATINNGNLFLENNFSVKVISLGEGLDPDDYIIKYGKDKFISLIANAISYKDYRINLLKKGVDFNSPDELSNYINSMLKEIANEKNEIKREILLKNLAKETNVWYNTLEKTLNEFLSKEKEQKVSLNMHIEPKKETKKDKYEKNLQELILAMLENKNVITIVNDAHIYIPMECYRTIIREIIYFYEKYGYINIPDFLTYMEEYPDLKIYLNEIISLDINPLDDKKTILEKVQVIKDYNRLENLIKNERDPMEQAKILDEIRKLKMGSEK